MSALGRRAAAIRALAAGAAVHLAPFEALLTWHEQAPPGLARALTAFAARLRQGEPTTTALASLDVLGSDAGTVALLFDLAERSGAALAPMLERLAAAIDERDRVLRAGVAAAAGARLSGRMIACLPLLFVPFTPAATRPAADPPGLMIVLVGVMLTLGGLRWINHLVPAPHSDDAAAVVAEGVAGILEVGVYPDVALTAVTESAPSAAREELRRAARRHALGASWTEALAMSEDEGLRELGDVLARSLWGGLPAVSALETFARHRRALAGQAFEARLRRAPVAMVLPLTLCILPAYGLLALAPFVRSVAASV